MRRLLTIVIVLLLITGCVPTASDPVTITQTLYYTASGDDGTVGQADWVEVCMAETEDSLSNNWDDCRVVIVAVPPMPFVKDTLIFDVDISTEVAYYYALITIDNVGNRSLISNIVEVVKEDTTPPARTGDLSATN